MVTHYISRPAVQQSRRELHGPSFSLYKPGLDLPSGLVWIEVITIKIPLVHCNRKDLAALWDNYLLLLSSTNMSKKEFIFKS
jgi:hypothetical protein